MREIQFPYGRGHLTCALEEERLNDVLLSGSGELCAQSTTSRSLCGWHWKTPLDSHG